MNQKRHPPKSQKPAQKPECEQIEVEVVAEPEPSPEVCLVVDVLVRV